MDDAATCTDLRRRLAAAEAALKRSEARFAATLESVPVGVAMLDMAGRIVSSNSEYQRFCPTGLMPSRDPDRLARWRGWHADGRPLRPDEFPGARAVRGESVVPGQEMLYTDDDGRDIWVQVATVPIRDEAGRPIGQASTISDIDTLKTSIEALRESERRHAFLLRLSDAIRPLDDPATIQETAVDLLGAHLGVDRCLYVEFLVEAGVDYAVVETEYRTPGTASFIGLHTAEQFGSDLLDLQADRVVAVADAEAAPSTDALRERWRSLRIRSRLGVPLMKQGRLVAGFTMQHHAPRGWSTDEIMLVRQTAERTWIAVEHVRSEARLRRREAELHEVQVRAQRLIDGIAIATWEATPDGAITVDSPSWRAVTGQTFDEWRRDGWLDAIHPDDRDASARRWQKAVDEGATIDAEHRIRSAAGGYRWTNVRVIPLRDETGTIRKWLGVNIDIDDRKRLERTVQDNERRMRALVEGVPQLLWRAADAHGWLWVSPPWTRFTGQSEEDSQGAGWLAAVHPDDRAPVLAAWARAAINGGFDVEHRLRSRDGDYRWFNTRAVPLRDGHDRIVEWLGTSNDIHDLRMAQERQEVMVAELHHRTRNLIAVVRSIADTMIDRAASLDDFASRFNDRLMALSRVQNLLSHTGGGQRVTFDGLLQTELAALGATGRGDGDAHLVLSGPADVPLRSRAVQSLALAIHELATNAVKYGALRTRQGRLAIVWQVRREADGMLWLHVDWRERGVTLPPSIVPPPTGGYGRQLIERALPYQLGARTQYAFKEDGVHCTIAVPVVSERAMEETDDG